MNGNRQGDEGFFGFVYFKGQGVYTPPEVIDFEGRIEISEEMQKIKDSKIRLLEKIVHVRFFHE